MQQSPGDPGQVVLIEQARQKYIRQLEINQLEEQARQEAELNSLCWTCQRATWSCLCGWPWESAPVVTRMGADGLQMVRSCRWYWPENQSRLIVGDNR